MKTLITPIPLLIAAILAAFALSQSSNATLWMACLLALPAIVWLAGGHKAPPVLLWVLGILWLQTIADVFLADLTAQPIVDNPAGSAGELAILFSLCAIGAMAAGMRGGNRFGQWLFRAKPDAGNVGYANETRIEIHRLVGCYVGILVVTQILSFSAQAMPLLLQPIVIINSLKYVFVYLVAITVLESEQNYFWLLLVAGLEILTGVIAYFSSYKESIYVILIALVSSHRPIRIRNLVLSAIALSGVIWLSLVWTVVKKEYRTVMFDMTFVQKLDYMADKYLEERFDYEDSLQELVRRIGYTRLYAQVIEMDQVGSLPRGFDYYKNAVWHILTPRILFTNKAVLNDSKGTEELLGMRIAHGTSIGVGYIAQAHTDFGFPGLLVPLGVIGFLLGLCWQYFVTRPVPAGLGAAFGVAALFLSFEYDENINKALGAFFTNWIGLGLILRFGYPAIRFLLALPPRIGTLPASGPVARAPS